MKYVARKKETKRHKTKRETHSCFSSLGLFGESRFSRGVPPPQIHDDATLDRSIRESFPSAFPPIFVTSLFITPHLKLSQLAEGERERRASGELLFLCARLLVKEKYVPTRRQCISALRRLDFRSRHNLFLCYCCCRYRGGV